MGNAAHPDQALLDDCRQWHVSIQEYNRLAEAGNDTAADAYYSAKITPVKDRIIATRALSSEGRIAKASVFKADYGKELADTDEYLEQFAASLCEDIIAEARPDRKLIDLCRRCVEALAANEAIYEAVPRGVDISDEVAEQASAHYNEQVVPLLNEIERTPAKTFEEVVAKARIWMSDRVQLSGEAHIDSACIQFLIDLSALDLVPEVPEAPYHKPAPKAAATQEAA